MYDRSILAAFASDSPILRRAAEQESEIANAIMVADVDYEAGRASILVAVRIMPWSLDDALIMFLLCPKKFMEMFRED